MAGLQGKDILHSPHLSVKKLGELKMFNVLPRGFLSNYVGSPMRERMVLHLIFGDVARQLNGISVDEHFRNKD